MAKSKDEEKWLVWKDRLAILVAIIVFAVVIWIFVMEATPVLVNKQ